MVFLDRNKMSTWFDQNGIIEKPYDANENLHGFYLRGNIPQNGGRLFAFIRSMMYSVNNFSTGLITVDDSALFDKDESFLFEACRKSNGGQGTNYEFPGAEFNASEITPIIGYCFISQIFRCSTYIYIPDANMTILFWEGLRIDVWVGDELLATNLKETIDFFEAPSNGDE